MANRTVQIFYSVRIDGQHKRLRPVMGKNNKIKPGWALFNNKETSFRDGSYTIGWYEGQHRMWKNTGPAPQDAVYAAERQRLYLEAARVGVPLKKDDSTSPALSIAIETYLEEYKLSRKPESYELVAQTLKAFLQHCKRVHLKDVTKLDLLKFANWLQVKKKNSPRTANNKFARVNQFLKEQGIAIATLRDAPQFVESKPEVYSEEQLKTFFAACDPYQTAVYKTFLLAGLRMQELMFLRWIDIDFANRIVHVKAKEDFTPKAYHERPVHVPVELIEILQQRLGKSSITATLVFPTKSGRPNDKLLQACKRTARRAGLNCGHCDTCQKQKECRDWFLHKFRATFATRLLQGGMDIESVREQMGHKDTESIARYLVPLKGAAMRKKVDAIFQHA